MWTPTTSAIAGDTSTPGPFRRRSTTPEDLPLSRTGVEYLLPIFANAIGQDDLEVMRETLFVAGNLFCPFHSVNTDINKRICYLEPTG